MACRTARSEETVHSVANATLVRLVLSLNNRRGRDVHNQVQVRIIRGALKISWDPRSQTYCVRISSGGERMGESILSWTEIMSLGSMSRICFHSGGYR